MKKRGSASEGGTVWLIYASTVGIMLLASFVSAGRLWGFNWYGYFSWYSPFVLFVLSASAAVLIGRRAAWKREPADDQAESQSVYWILFAGFSGLAGLAFVFLSARTHFLGDGYLVISRLESGGVGNRAYNTGVYFLLDQLYGWLGGEGNSRAELAYRMISWLCGILFVFGAGLTAARLFSATRLRLLFFGGLATGGYALLFFGYTENYPLFVLAVAASTFLGLLAMAGKNSRWWVLIPSAAAPFLHPFAVVLIPGTLFVLLWDSAAMRRYQALSATTRRLFWFGVLAFGAVGFFWAYSASIFLRLSLVPPITNRFTVEGYTMFSGKHLLDYANLLFQLAPGAPILLYLWVSLRRHHLISRPEYAFLMLLVAPSLLIAFIFDPKLGMPRDWDVFAFVGVPMVTLLFFTALDIKNGIKGYAVIAALALVLGLLELMPRVITQVIPEKSIAVFDSYLDLDAVKNESGAYLLLQYLEKNGRLVERAAREREYTRLFPHEIWDREGQAFLRDGKIPEAEAKFRRAVAYAPNFSYSWGNIGTCFGRRKQWDSALVYFKIADALNPGSSDTYTCLGYVYLFLGDSKRAEEYCLDAIRIHPADFISRDNLARLYREQGRREDLIRLLLGLIDLDSVPSQYYFDAANQLLRLDASDAAARLCRRALELGADSSFVTQLQAAYPQFRLGQSVR